MLSFSDDGRIVENSKNSVHNSENISDLASICKYKTLVKLVKKFESSEFTILEAWNDLNSFKSEIRSCDSANILPYLEERLNSNPDLKEIIYSSGDMSPSEYACLQSAQPSSEDVERSFSKLNRLLSDDRNFLDENVSSYIISYVNTSDD